MKEIFTSADFDTHGGEIKFKAAQLASHLNKYLGKNGKYIGRRITLLLKDYDISPSPHSTRYNTLTIQNFDTYEATKHKAQGNYYTYNIKDYLSKEDIKNLFSKEQQQIIFKGICPDCELKEKDCKCDMPF